MAFRLIEEVLERVNYERGRVKKLLPTLIRLGISELEDLLHRLRHLNGSCDHTRGGRPRRTAKVRRVKRKPRR